MSDLRRDALGLFLNGIFTRSRLSDEERDVILNLPGDIVHVRSNQDLVRLGEVVSATCLVVDGAMARFGQTRDGQRQISALYIPGDMPDLHSFVIPRASWALTALTRSTVMRVPHSAVGLLVERYPNIAAAFWRHCTLDAASTTEWILNIGRRTALARIAHLLCEMAARNEQIGRFKGLSFPFPLTQGHMGDALGLTPVHVNRMLGQLKRSNIVTITDRAAQIHDWNALVSAADFDPGYLHFDNSTDAGRI